MTDKKKEYLEFWDLLGKGPGAGLDGNATTKHQSSSSDNRNEKPATADRVRLRPKQTHRENGCEVLIVTAVDDEFHAAKAAFSGSSNLEEVEIEDLIYFRTSYSCNRSDIRIGFLHLAEMGMVPAAAKVTRYVSILDCQLVIMVGICGGREGKVAIGDVIIANTVFNYDQVKREEDGNIADYPFSPIGEKVSTIVRTLTQNTSFATSIEDRWPPEAHRPNTRLSVHYGPIATGSALVADRAVFREINTHQRKAIGLDMEAYGVARACHYLDTRALIIKSVSDFAGEDKSESGKANIGNSQFRKYCCFVAAEAARMFVDRAFSTKLLGASLKRS